MSPQKRKKNMLPLATVTRSVVTPPDVPEITTWYIEPVGSYTNQVISDALAEDKDAEYCGLKKLKDGKFHPLWRCSEERKDEFELSRVDKKITFNVFCKIGVDGEIEPSAPSATSADQNALHAKSDGCGKTCRKCPACRSRSKH